MTEEQFWRSNPRIIKVWESAWREEQIRQNELMHMYVGNYFMSAMTTAVDHCLNGAKAKTKYIEKPIQLFELTEEEKEQQKLKAREAFLMWAKRAESKYKNK
jgi:hypothetical protein